MAGAELSTAEVALLVGVTSETVRKWCEAGRFKARRVGPRGVWRIDSSSVPMAEVVDLTESADVRGQLIDIRRVLEAVQEAQSNQTSALVAVERERDRFRAENAALRESALRLNAAARETHQAVRHLATILEEQSNALEQLLAPASALDLMR